jgi:hypothetical protein
MKRAILAILTILCAVRAGAQVRPTSRSHFVPAPVPFERAHQATLAAKRRAPVARQSPSPTTPPEIVELARALQNDPDLIYQYVHDNIEFSPLWGYLKGPVGTLLDGRGDSFDQASLMVALLNQASLSNPAISNVNFVIGQLTLTNAQLQGWLNVDSNPNSIGGILGSAGFPGNTFEDGSASIGHVWVSVTINGTAYVFDPAFKSHTWKTGIVSNLPGIMGRNCHRHVDSEREPDSAAERSDDLRHQFSQLYPYESAVGRRQRCGGRGNDRAYSLRQRGDGKADEQSESGYVGNACRGGHHPERVFCDVIGRSAGRCRADFQFHRYIWPPSLDLFRYVLHADLVPGRSRSSKRRSGLRGRFGRSR